MGSTEKIPPPTEEAFKRLSVDKSTEIRDRAHRLGQLVQRNLEVANTNPRMRSAGARAGDMRDAVDKERRVSERRGAYLVFRVPSRFQALEGTADWLPHAQRAALMYNTYDVDLPDDMGEIPDPTDSIVYYLAPAPEYAAETEESHDQPYVASYEDGSRLDPQNTETVIGILAMIAEQAGNDAGGQALA